MNVAEPGHTPKSILYVITKANWGGAQRYVYDIATAAYGEGYEVTVACGSTYHEMSDRLRHANIPVISIDALGRDVAPLADVKALVQLTRLMRSMKPHVVHANSSKAGLLAVIAARLSRVPRIIFTAHGWAFNETRPWWHKVIFSVFHFITVWGADITICNSEATRRDAMKLTLGMPFIKKRLVVIHHGITEIELAQKDAARAALAPHLSPALASPSTLWLGTLAELHPTKGLDIAIRAFATIATQFPNTLLVLIGEGQDRNYLVQLARQLGVSERVHFCGHVSHAPKFLTALDIFLFPSRSESFGYAALEAGHARLPVIASNVGGIPEIIDNEKSGLLVPVGDVEKFAAAMTNLIEHPDERSKLGNALYESVTHHFSKTTMADKTLTWYE